ncbi:MAG: helix-turn-helix domain-containing protein [Candidatus Omnitrophica bacterium]|nr:helix-turn-helix domain-containing protein [Candidatus Omnitrophota bacterium]
MENASAWKNWNGRKLNRQAREALRLLAVQRVEAGESPEAVDQPLGFHRSSIYVWLAIYREHGLNGLRSKPIPAVRPN